MTESRRGEELVYGSFSKLFELKIYGNIAEAGRLWMKLRDLDRSLFAGFISYILARAGYYSKTIFDISGNRTIDYSDEDWLSDIELLIMAWAEELSDLLRTIGDLADTPLLQEHLTWSQYFQKMDNRDLMKVIFVSRQPPVW